MNSYLGACLNFLSVLKKIESWKPRDSDWSSVKSQTRQHWDENDGFLVLQLITSVLLKKNGLHVITEKLKTTRSVD